MIALSNSDSKVFTVPKDSSPKESLPETLLFPAKHIAFEGPDHSIKTCLGHEGLQIERKKLKAFMCFTSEPDLASNSQEA